MKEKLRILLIILLIMGVFFRFVNLEGKSYWIDEVFTSLRISGYTQAEVIQEVSQGQVISLDELQKYQRPNPEKGVSGTIQGLALEEPQIPPLFFVMARFWTEIFGHSPAITRGFSSLISLLAFPAVYWLCNELFVLPLTGWMAMALIAVSPFQILYAREARNYSLWAVIILLSSWSLLRAIRINKKSNWAIYATTVAVGFYAHLFFALVAIGHGIYILALQNRWTKNVTAYLLASLLGVLAFAPWIWIVINYSASVTKTTGWQSQRKSLLSLIITWIGNISRAFLDLGVNSSIPLSYQITLGVVILFIVYLVAYSLYFLVKTTPKNIWLFVITLIATPALALILPDLLFGGYRSAMSRYLMSCQLGILIAVAYLLANKISSDLLPRYKKKLWQICGVILITSAVLSGIVGSQAETWWNMAYGYQFAPVAKIINQATRPLVISEISGNNLGNLLALSYSLKPEVRFQFFPETKPFPQIASDFSERFIYGDSDKSFQQLAEAQNLKRVPIYQAQQDQKTWLWKLVK